MLMHPGPLRIVVSQIALLLAVTAVLIAGPARAADTGNGSKNFRVPASVPNYFSNEAGPMMGAAAETRRGELYSNQTAQAPQPQAAARITAAAPRARQHFAMAEPRGRLIRGRRGTPVYAHHVAVHGRSLARVASHGSSRTRATHLASYTHTVGKAHMVGKSHAVGKAATRVSSAHRHARG
jgi:hypothetical protein